MENIEKNILSFFHNIPNIVAIILFGSFARDAANEQSDLDIAILCEKEHVPSSEILIEWREGLSDQFKRDVDLICLNTASPIIGMQVYKNGKNLIVKNERQFAEYQIRLFTDYAELKELRAPMEKDILKRKLYDGS